MGKQKKKDKPTLSKMDKEQAEELQLKGETLLKQIDEVLLVVLDVAHELPAKAHRSMMIQSMLTRAQAVVDTALKIAQREQIAFSFMGADTAYDTQGDRIGVLVHADTKKVEVLEEKIEDMRGQFDSSDFSCPGG